MSNFLTSNFGQLQDTLRKKLYSGTKLQLTSPGRIRKFPRVTRSRFVLPTSSEVEFGTYAGSTTIASANNGSKFLQTDTLPTLNDYLVISINSQKYGVLESTDKSITLYKNLTEAISPNQTFFYDSYAVTVDGNYGDGFKQILVKSILPVVPGDQWFIPIPDGSVKPAIVVQAKKTLNVNQWDVILDRATIVKIPAMVKGDVITTRTVPNTFPISAPLFFVQNLKNGNYLCSFSPTNTNSTIEIQPIQILSILRDTTTIYYRDASTDKVVVSKDPIYVQASSTVYWDNIPLDIGPCIVSLPTATHLQKTAASVVNCVQTLSGDRVIRHNLTKKTSFKISTGTIPAQSWSNAQLLEGRYDYLPGLAHFVPKPNAIAKLTFLDSLSGVDINKWTCTVRAEQPGHIIFLFKGKQQKFDLVRGLNSLVIEVPQEDFSWVEISTDTEIYVGGLNSTDQVSHLNLALHVFKSENLGSHIFGRPSLHSLIKDPSLTWARVGLSGVNRGYTLTPSNGDYKILHQSLRVPPPDYVPPVLPRIPDPPTSSLTASNLNPLFGATDVTITPQWTGSEAFLGTSQGSGDLQYNPIRGVEIPVHTGTGFNAPQTYWLRSINEIGNFADSQITINPMAVSITISPTSVTLTNPPAGFGSGLFGIAHFGQ
jgi:hypothetical protein